MSSSQLEKVSGLWRTKNGGVVKGRITKADFLRIIGGINGNDVELVLFENNTKKTPKSPDMTLKVQAYTPYEGGGARAG